MRIGLLAIGGWLVAAVLTVGVSWSAISVVRDAVAAGPSVATALPTPDETAGPTATRTTAPPRPGPTTAAARIVSRTGQGGSVSVRCAGGRPEFVTVVPRQGYTVETDDSGDEVKLRSGSARTEFTASCAGGVPRVTVEDKGSGGDDD